MQHIVVTIKFGHRKFDRKKAVKLTLINERLHVLVCKDYFVILDGHEFLKQGLIRNICYIMSGQVIHSCRKGLFHDPYWSNRQNTSQSASQFWTFFFMHIQVNLKCTIKKAQLQRSGLLFICCPTRIRTKNLLIQNQMCCQLHHRTKSNIEQRECKVTKKSIPANIF